MSSRIHPQARTAPKIRQEIKDSGLASRRQPQTNGMVERVNGRINELQQRTRFDSRADLQATLLNYLKLYHHHIPQRAIGSKTPILALKEWQKERPELFVRMKWTPPTSTGGTTNSKKEARDSGRGGPSRANGVKAPKVKVPELSRLTGGSTS